MPWDYKTNPPEAVKFFKPSIQKKSIEIANAILRNGGDEGIAIATGIKKAKEMHVKSFSKTASLNWADDAASGQMNVMQQTQAMNNAVVMPKIKKFRQPTSMASNFSHIGNIQA